MQDGHLLCRFNRIKNVDSNNPEADKIYDLNQAWYLLFPTGSVASDGEICHTHILYRLFLENMWVFRQWCVSRGIDEWLS